jgi:hypothetical protein
MQLRRRRRHCPGPGQAAARRHAAEREAPALSLRQVSGAVWCSGARQIS